MGFLLVPDGGMSVKSPVPPIENAETSLDPLLATKRNFPIGEITTDAGSDPPTETGFELPAAGGIGVKTPAAPILNAVTLSEPPLTTYRYFVSEEMAIAPGVVPTAAGLGLSPVDGTKMRPPSVDTLNAVTLFARLLATNVKNPSDDIAIADGPGRFANGEPAIGTNAPVAALMLYPDTLLEPLLVT
jgi:hypothetical protein